MATITSQQKRKDKDDIIDMTLIKQAYGSDYPRRVTSQPLEINTYADPTIISKSIVPSVDLEDEISLHRNQHLSK